MDFDHVGEKTGEVSSFVNSSSTRRVLVEVAQCEVVCSNCHRIRTYLRLQDRMRSSLEADGGLASQLPVRLAGPDYNRVAGMWRSLVSARRLGRRGRRFESGHPDHSGQLRFAL
jgi:hypothetical protein